MAAAPASRRRASPRRSPLRDDLPNGDLGYPATVGSQDSRLYALDAHSGRQFWIFAAAGWVESSPAVSGGVVYVGSNDGRLYALDAHTGANRASPVSKGFSTSR